MLSLAQVLVEVLLEVLVLPCTNCMLPDAAWLVQCSRQRQHDQTPEAQQWPA